MKTVVPLTGEGLIPKTFRDESGVETAEPIKVSVIIAFYGQYCDFANVCLASLQRQGFRDFEIIFVQDGPSEFQAVLQSDLSNSGLVSTYLVNSENQGALASRIKAVNQARGRYLAFLDHDDAYDNNFLTEMYGKATQLGADVVECPINNINPSGEQELFHRFGCGDCREGFEILHRYIIGFSHNSLVNKLICSRLFRIAEEELFRDLPMMNWSFSEDLLLTSVVCKNAFRYVATCDTRYNYHRRSVSTVNPGDLERITLILRQIEIVAEFVNRKYSPLVSRGDLCQFHLRETRWSLDHMSHCLKGISPKDSQEALGRARCLLKVRYLKLRLLGWRWLASRIARLRRGRLSH